MSSYLKKFTNGTFKYTDAICDIMTKKTPMIGCKFGKLTVIGDAGTDAAGRAIWECVCDCGNRCIVRGLELRTNHTRSCGCLKAQISAKTHTLHGQTGLPLYICWNNIKQRCNNPKATGYANYGGRGIHICDEWADDFKNFQDWAMMNGWTEGLTIERKDVNGDYCPENCIWITKTEQKYNRTDSHHITYEGRTQTLAQWAKELGISPATLRYRLKNWPLERALMLKK